MQKQCHESHQQIRPGGKVLQSGKRFFAAWRLCPGATEDGDYVGSGQIEDRGSGK